MPSVQIFFNVEGLEWAVETVRKASNPERLDKIVNDLGEIGYDFATSLCPVRTGYLRSTIKHVHSWMTSIVFVGARYAIFVEFGTYKMSAQPFMRPARYVVIEAANQIKWE